MRTAMDEINEAYDLAINEGIIKEDLTEIERIEWFNRGRDESKDSEEIL